MELKFNKIKGSPESLRISGLDIKALEKAVNYNGNCLKAVNEKDVPEFEISFINSGKSTVDNYTLKINKSDVKEGLVVVHISSNNPQAAIVRAVAYITKLCNEAENVAKAFDEALAQITEI